MWKAETQYLESAARCTTVYEGLLPGVRGNKSEIIKTFNFTSNIMTQLMFYGLQVTAVRERQWRFQYTGTDSNRDVCRTHLPFRYWALIYYKMFYMNDSHLISSNFFDNSENKSYSSVRTEALSVVDLIVKRTGGEWGFLCEVVIMYTIVQVHFSPLCFVNAF